jgi:menaquinone-dependent protoporphyrinogen IX oxidase
MKGVVIYKSKYGATQQYAQWIGAELNLPVFETEELDGVKLNSYDFIVAGSSVYMGKMLIKKWLKENLDTLWHKKIFLFVVSGTPVDKKDKLDSYVTASVPEEVRNRMDIYFLPGKLVITELSLFDRLLIKAGARMSERKNRNKKMVNEYNNISKSYIAELTKTIRTFSNLAYSTFRQISKTQFDSLANTHDR